MRKKKCLEILVTFVCLVLNSGTVLLAQSPYSYSVSPSDSPSPTDYIVPSESMSPAPSAFPNATQMPSLSPTVSPAPSLSPTPTASPTASLNPEILSYEEIDEFREELDQSDSAESTMAAVISFFSSAPESERADAWIDSRENIESAFLRTPEAAFSVMRDLLSTDESNLTISSEIELGAQGRVSVPRKLSDYAIDVMGVVDPIKAVEESTKLVEGDSRGSNKILGVRNLIWASRKLPNSTLEKDTFQMVKEQVADESWSKPDDVDFAEAFDVFVALEKYEEIPFLLSKIGGLDTYSTWWPAYLTVFKLAERDSVRALSEVLKNFESLESYPGLRADLFALLQAMEPGAEEVLISYLERLSLPEEMVQFSESFPSRNSFLSDTLLSEDLDLSQGSPKNVFLKSESDFEKEYKYIVGLMARLTDTGTFSDEVLLVINEIGTRLNDSVQ